MFGPAMALIPGGVPAMATLDPHFTGFDGKKFDFHGVPGRFYALFSDKFIQINSHFRHWVTSGSSNFTAMQTLGIVCRENLIEIDATDKLKINGKNIENLPFSTEDIGVSLVSEIPEEVKDVNGSQEFGHFVKAYLVSMLEIDFMAIIATDHVNEPCFNILSKLKMDIQPHGILGQTVNKDREQAVEGADEDYEVSSLFASDFKFNKFKAPPQ